MKILVVDDEGIVLQCCQRVLESEGFEVVLVPSAEAALQTMETHASNSILPSVILIDLKMPIHDGMYLMNIMKQKWPDIPIVIMSGYSTDETIIQAKKQGACCFIAKPFTPDELFATILQVI
ncbi:MAG: response regulator [Desulfobacterales bacterium]|nr:response regulator [Desulfobacterales bacterium]